MNSMTIQWAALILCSVGVTIRVPGLLRGQGRTIFAALVLLTVAVALSLEPIYNAVDALLGGTNVANLILRLLLYAVFVLLGVRMAAAFGSAIGRRLIVGPFGLVVLLLTVSATLYFFVGSELPTTSRGLNAYGDQQTVRQYAAAGRFYPGYVSACLVLPALVSVFDSHARPLHRVAGAFLASGFALVVVFVILRFTPLEIGAWDVVLPFSAILLVVVGLCLIRLSHTLGERKRRQVNLLA